MNIQHYKLNLDLLKNTSTPVLYSHQLDKKSRFIDVTLTANDAEVTLDSTMTAVLNATTNNVIVAESQNCTISNNVIVVELTDKVLSLPGVTKCEVVLSDSSGAVITAQHFIVKITEKAINSKSKYEPNGGTLATKDDINTAIEKVKDEVLTKADKATTLEGYGITDTYNKTYLDKALKDKLNKMPFDTTLSLNSPNYVTSGTVYNAMQSKANKTSFEQGTGNLSCIDDVAKSVIKSASFNYVKNNNAVTITFNIVFNAGTIPQSGFVRFSGLPFKTLNAEQLLSKVVDNKNKEYYCKLYGTWLSFTVASGASVVADEAISFSATYII